MLKRLTEGAFQASRGRIRMNIDDLLRIATERRASDLHLKVGNYPHLRIDGELVPLTDQPRISAEDMLNMAFSMMSARQKQKFKETTEIDMAYGVAGLGRFRVNIFQQRGNVGLVLRVIPTKIRALDELFLPKVVEQICDMPRGLVLVTGVTGSGKSTTLAAMVDRVNSSRAEHIVTIEDPIEFLHRDKKGYVNQREIGVDTPSFGAALRASLASGSGRDPGRRNARPGNDFDGAARGRNRPHGVLDSAHAGRGGNHQPYHFDFPAAGAEADSHAVGGGAARDRQPAAGAALRCRRARARGGSHDQHRVTSASAFWCRKRRDRFATRSRQVLRSTACRRSTSRFGICSRPGWSITKPLLRTLRTPTTSNCECRVSLRRRTFRGSRCSRRGLAGGNFVSRFQVTFLIRRVLATRFLLLGAANSFTQGHKYEERALFYRFPSYLA